MPTIPNPYRQDLSRQAANHVALTPLSLLEWAADIFPEKLAVIHGDLRLTWAQYRERCHQLGSALSRLDIGRGDTVAVMLPNTPPMLEAHYGVALAGAVLNSVNTRLDAAAVAFILEHSQSRVFIVDREFAPLAGEALALLREKGAALPTVIDALDPVYVAECQAAGKAPSEALSSTDYDAFVAAGDPAFVGVRPEDEFDAIGLNYTSGTTGDPKGVVVHHRGAYLNAVGNVLSWALPRHPTYLWTLPLFHCNGWCFPWTMAAVAGTNVCLRRVDPALIFSLIREHKATHFCAAPIVHSMLLSAPAEVRAGIDHQVSCMVAGAAPPAAMIGGMEELGFELTHVYGLTEVYGPSAVCMKQDDWQSLSLAERVQRNARQGVRYTMQEGLTVLDPETLEPVPHDGETMGEVMFRGNVVMAGYLKNPKATAAAFKGGWFHTGDLGVIDKDGYVKLKDRSKDVIISGGENISSIEVEDALYLHPAVMTCAVIARPDPKWGETPLAIIETRPDHTPHNDAERAALATELIAHCRRHLAHYKCPREIRFEAIPKTSTGKIQKHILRSRAGSAGAIG